MSLPTGATPAGGSSRRATPVARSIRPHMVSRLNVGPDGKLYIGYSSNLKQRLTDHFNGRDQATAPRRPLRLIYCEYHASTTDAHRREKYFKTTAGKKALGLMLRDTLSSLRE